jgi:hypothetical protein
VVTALAVVLGEALRRTGGLADAPGGEPTPHATGGAFMSSPLSGTEASREGMAPDDST